MSATYQAILWNRQKKVYDTILVLFIVVYIGLFVGINLILFPEVTEETLIIRSTATLALLMLHVILAIGPLSRLHPAFLPLLYNRRHLGVTMFLIASCHGIFSIVQFHALGNIHPIISVFTSNQHFDSLTRFPFQTLGFVALLIFFLMASTSHDFWLHNLGARWWKTLHMLVYVAYTLIILHVALGVLQYETSPALVILLSIGLSTIITLHLIAGWQEYQKEKISYSITEGFVKVSHVDEIVENRAKVVCLQHERIAVFKYNNKVSAISNVCKHQNGPLGEGRIIDGCITCPWHGYQYLPHNGSSPPPFTEKVATYQVKIINNEIWVNPTPFPEGTELEPAIIK